MEFIIWQAESTYGTKYSTMDQVKFVEDSFKKILLSAFLNVLSHIFR